MLHCQAALPIATTKELEDAAWGIPPPAFAAPAAPREPSITIHDSPLLRVVFMV
jgi:hypothetical protein